MRSVVHRVEDRAQQVLRALQSGEACEPGKGMAVCREERQKADFLRHVFVRT